MVGLPRRLMLCFVVLTAVSAVPVESILETRDVSQGLIDIFTLMSQFSAAAYCPANNNSPGTPLVCAQGNCPLVEAADTHSIVEFQDTPETDTTGYVAVSRKLSMIIVAFRGSRSARNWIADFAFAFGPVTIPGCKNCNGHQGFWQSWQQARDPVTHGLQTAQAENPEYQIVVTGHSLGGAIASLAAAELRTMGFNVSLYTFGAPRVGDPALSAFISDQSGNYRLTHGCDIVPQLPPIVFGYRHISPEYFITSGQDVVPGPKDITVLYGGWNFHGNTGRIPGNVESHLWYFGKIAGCDSGIEWKRDLESAGIPVEWGPKRG